MAAARIAAGQQDKLYLGNLDAVRDWGFAGDYVEAMWRIVQKDAPGDYVIATGEAHTVREFCQLAFARAGIDLEFSGAAVAEVAKDRATGREVIAIDPRYFRLAEVNLLQGDASKARRELGWEPTVSFQKLVEMMVDSDIQAARTGAPFVSELSLPALAALVE